MRIYWTSFLQNGFHLSSYTNVFRKLSQVKGDLLKKIRYLVTWCREKLCKSVSKLIEISPKGSKEQKAILAISNIRFGQLGHSEEAVPTGYSKYDPQHWFFPESPKKNVREDVSWWGKQEKCEFMKLSLCCTELSFSPEDWTHKLFHPGYSCLQSIAPLLCTQGYFEIVPQFLESLIWL